MLNTEYYTMKGGRATCTKCDSSQVITSLCCTSTVPYGRLSSTIKGGTDTVNIPGGLGLVYSEHYAMHDNVTLCYLIPCSMVQSSIPKAYRLDCKVRVRIA